MFCILPTILAIVIAIAFSLFFTPQRKLVQVLIPVSTVLALVVADGLPAIAAANPVPLALNSDAQLLQQQPFKFEEGIYVSANQCSGLCIAQEQTGIQSDISLLQAINAKVPHEENLDIKVDNGAVFLSGSVKDETTAHDLIKQVETIPGVHWITVDLALTHQAQPVAG